MLFAEIISILYPSMADAFANLPKVERIEKAVCACQQDSRLTARKAGKIYNGVHSTISRRLKEPHKSRAVIAETQQLLTPVEERTIVRFVIQYYKWGLPLSLKQIRQFANEILLRYVHSLKAVCPS
jgi:helix-turn-helix, Psq domain